MLKFTSKFYILFTPKLQVGSSWGLEEWKAETCKRKRSCALKAYHVPGTVLGSIMKVVGGGGTGRGGYLAARSAWHIPRDQVRSAVQNTQQASATSRNNTELPGQSSYWLPCVNFVGHLQHSYKWWTDARKESILQPLTISTHNWGPLLFSVKAVNSIIPAIRKTN